MSFLKSLYTFSISLLVLAFMVFGLAAIPAPEPPDIPPELAAIEEDPTEEEQELLAEYRQQQETFQQQVSFYNQVVSFVLIGAAVVLLAASILWLRGMVIISDAVALGGVFTLLYGLYYAYSVEAGLLTFVAVLLGLVLLFALVYWRFVHLKDELGGIPVHDQPPTPEQQKRDSVRIAGKKGTAS
jgi:hypothetical protein